MFPPYKYIITRILRNVNKNIRKIRKNSRDFHTTKLNLPTGNLDAASAETVAQMLTLAASKYQQTIVMVTHDRQMAEYADRILTITDGNVTGGVGV